MELIGSMKKNGYEHDFQHEYFWFNSYSISYLKSADLWTDFFGNFLTIESQDFLNGEKDGVKKIQRSSQFFLFLDDP